MTDWILEYGKYALVAAAIFFGLDRAGHEIAEGVAQITMISGGSVISHAMFVGGGPGPLVQFGEDGLLLHGGATKYDMP